MEKDIKQCLYCSNEIVGLRKDAKFCCENHKDYFNARRRKKENAETIKELKSRFPFLFDQEWSEKDTEYINWCHHNRTKVEKIIFNI